MNLNAQYRSERIEIDVNNSEGLLAPGMYADVVLSTKAGINGLSVPSSAVVTSTERKYVLVVRNNQTVKVDVRTGNTGAGKTEIFGAVQQGEKVIANANDEMPEGVMVGGQQDESPSALSISH